MYHLQWGHLSKFLIITSRSYQFFTSTQPKREDLEWPSLNRLWIVRPSVPRHPVIVIWPGKTDGSLLSAVWQMGGCASECAQVSINPPLPTPDITRRRAAFLRILPKQAVIVMMWFVFNFSYFLLELRKCSIRNLGWEIHVIHLWKLMIFKDQ